MPNLPKMNDNEILSFLQELRTQLEIDMDAMREAQWVKWRQWDYKILMKMKEITELTNEMLEDEAKVNREA